MAQMMMSIGVCSSLVNTEPYAGRIPVAVRLALNGIRQTCEEILSGIETRL